VAELDIVASEIADVPNAVCVQITGIVDVTTEDKLKDKLDALVKSGFARFLLNLGGLQFLNSNGFAALVALSDKLRELGGSLVLQDVPEEIDEMATFLGLREFFAIAQNADDAFSKLKRVRDTGSFVPLAAQAESDPEIRLSSLGPAPAPSPYEARIRKETKILRRGNTDKTIKDEPIKRFVTAQYVSSVELHKYYPLRIIINKTGVAAQPAEANVAQVASGEPFAILGENPYVTILPRFKSGLINPLHTNLDVSIENVEYTFWLMPLTQEGIESLKVEVLYGKEKLAELLTPLKAEVDLL